MTNWINELKQSGFIRNVATVATGTATAQAITMLFSPLITRLYGPESFGLQGLFISILNILVPLSILGYPTAIVLPKRDHDAISLVKVIMVSATCTALIVSVLLYFSGEWLVELLNAQSLGSLIYFIPVALVGSAISITLSQWMIRKQAYGINARFQVFTAFLVNTTKSSLGAVIPGPGTLIATNVIGGMVGAILTISGWLKWKPVVENDPTQYRKGLVEIAKEYRDFPLYRTPQHFINTASQGLPVLILASGYGAGSVGHFSIALAVLAVPAALVSDSVASVFYPRITSAVQNHENVQRIIINATFAMGALGAVPYLLVIIFGPELFQLVFGDEWREGGRYAQWLSIWLYFQFVHKPAVAAVPALGLNKNLLIYEIISSTTKISALIFGLVYFKSAIECIALFSLIGTVSYIFLIFWLIRKSPKDKCVSV